MSPTTPQQTIAEFSTLLAAGDLDGLLGLYEDDAVFAPEPGRTVSGAPAIRAALEPFLALRPQMTGELRKVLVAQDTALVINRWQLRGTGPGGEPIELAGTSADVLRQRADGSWRIVIDDPWGGEGA